MEKKKPEVKCAFEKYVAIDKLIPNPKNPQKHSPEQIDRIAKNIQELGIRHPIIVSKTSGYIVAGHGRLEALKKLKVVKVPVDTQEFDSPDAEYAFMVSDNALQQEFAELDKAMINADFTALGPDFDMELLGLKDFNIDIEHNIDDFDNTLSPEENSNLVKFICGDIKGMVDNSDYLKLKTYFSQFGEDLMINKFKKLVEKLNEI